MNTINDIKTLRQRVKELEEQRVTEWKGMKSRASNQYEQLKPANLIRNTFDGLTNSLNNDSDMLREGAALVTGLVVNSLMSGSKNKALKKGLSVALFSIAMYFITQHRDDIVNAGNKVMEFISDRINKIKDKAAARKARKEAEEEEE